MQSASVHLSIDVESEPISGSLRTDDAEPRGFCGWIELVEALELVRHPDPGERGGKTLGWAPGAKL